MCRWCQKLQCCSNIHSSWACLLNTVLHYLRRDECRLPFTVHWDYVAWKRSIKSNSSCFPLHYLYTQQETHYLLLYNGCETWLLTSREEHRLRVFETRVLKQIFGTKREEETRHGEKTPQWGASFLLPTKYYSDDQSRRMRWAEHVACMGEKRNAHRILAGKTEGRRRLGSRRHRW